jgi:hypothetical protein
VKLVATWLKSQESTLEDPHTVTWDDGHTATMKEFWDHSDDTRLCIAQKGGGIEWHLFPDVVAEVYWCRHGRVWGIRGDGVEPASLYVNDPNASDDVLEFALNAMPVVYRAKINRPIN